MTGVDVAVCDNNQCFLIPVLGMEVRRRVVGDAGRRMVASARLDVTDQPRPGPARDARRI
jgi:hypothetical protein